MGNRDKIMALYRFEGVYFGKEGSQTLWSTDYDTDNWDEKCLHTHLTDMREVWLAECEQVTSYRVKLAKNDYRLLSFVKWDELMNEIEPKA